jgi:hypothetical protein
MWNWLNLNVITTLLRYVLTAAGTWVVAKGWVGAEAWAEIVAGILAIAAALWGTYESARNKVVTDNGKTVVAMKDLPPTTVQAVETSAAAAVAKK